MGDLVSAAAPPPLYVCVHLPEFPAQARLRLRPESARLPVVILAGDPPLERVCSANPKALALGITSGTTRAELDSFGDLIAMRRSPEEERGARRAVLHATEAFTPRMQIQSVASPHTAALTVVLDMTGTTPLFGPSPQVSRAILASVRSLGLSAGVAASANYYAAVCAAPFAREEPMILQRGKEREALRGLPLAALQPTDEQRNVFDLWGLNTLGELAQLPEVELIARLGQGGKRLRALARGEHPHFMVPEEPVFTAEEFLAFDAPEERLDSLLFVLGSMLDQIIVRVQSHALEIASLTVRLTLDGGGEHCRTLKPALPLTERAVWLRLLHLDLQAYPPAAAITATHLQAEPGKRRNVQTGLFSPPLPEPARLDVTLARIAALVGEDHVGKARLLDTHRPDSFAMERFAVPATTSAPQKSHATVALRRLRPPFPLQMQLNAREPGAFVFRGLRYKVLHAYGPWRCSGDWWTTEVWSLEEWDVCATSGEGEDLLCILMQNLLEKQWQMKALYD